MLGTRAQKGTSPEGTAGLGFGTESLWDPGENLQPFRLEVWDGVRYGQNTIGFAIDG